MLQRFESKLWNVQDHGYGESMRMCSSTPVVIFGIDYPKPSYCEDRVRFTRIAISISFEILFVQGNGTWGIWDVQDVACE